MALSRRARELKHGAWLAKKGLSVRLDTTRSSVRDRMLAVRSMMTPPGYTGSEFPDSFISQREKSGNFQAAHTLPRRVFCLWTGDNDMTPNRREALAQLREENPTVQVVLVTVDNLADWALPENPIPESYQNLSLVHRSDFLRCYLMHHHGGGYVDIKRGYGDLSQCFDRLSTKTDRWLMGYPERSARDVSDEAGSIYASLQLHHRRIPANGAFIARRGTPLTDEWYAEVLRRLDRYSESLAKAPGNVLGDNEGYPIPWGALQGATFQPTCLKYLERVMLDERLRPSLVDYR